MIIRKPFKFLIRYFKIINLVILIFLSFITYKCGLLSVFFKNYISSGYLTNETSLASKYIGIFLPITILIVILLSLSIYILFKIKDKEKEYRIYLYIIIYYLILFFISFITRSILNTYELTEIATSTALMYRDLSRFFFYPNFFFIFFIFLNTIGFNLRRFEFIDLKDEIDEEEEDNALIELNVGFESYKLKRTFHRTLRELKYYIIENKVVFKIIGVLIAIIFFFFLGKWLINLNKVVKTTESFNHQNFNISITDSILTTLDYQGNTIKDNTYFLAIKVHTTNTSTKSLTLDTDNFWLDMGSYYIYPTLDRSGKFIDLGEPYFGEKIPSKETHDYILVYELTTKEVKQSYNIKILDTIKYTDGVANPKYKQINLTPKKITQITTNDTYNIGDYLLLNNTKLLNTSVRINDYYQTSIYNYKYSYCQNDICNEKLGVISTANDTSKTLLVLDSEINIDNNSSYKQFKKTSNFYEDFTTIEYNLYDKTYISKVVDKTSPNDLSSLTVLEVDYNISKASNITLIITVRNERYKIILK